MDYKTSTNAKGTVKRSVPVLVSIIAAKAILNQFPAIGPVIEGAGLDAVTTVGAAIFAGLNYLKGWLNHKKGFKIP